MRLKREDEILDPSVRAALITEIEGTENLRRKDEAFRRWQIYKDKTSTFVTDLMLQQFSEDTVREMTYSITNISMARKIVKKLSRVYNNGATRVVVDEDGKPQDDETAVVQKLEELLKVNQKMKRLNNMVKLQKNAVSYIKPCPFFDKDGNRKMRIRLSPMNPYLYDVVEEFYDRTEPLVYILSNYQPFSRLYTSLDPATVRTQSGLLRAGFATHVSPHGAQGGQFGDRQDQKIADKKEDEDLDTSEDKDYIIWTDKYHFTMNSKAQILDPDTGEAIRGDISKDDERILNPIGVKPVVNFPVDQDNSFWAEGGEDLVDAAIVVNSMLSQINHIGVVQGYGQFWMTGKDLPRNLTIGPNKNIQLEYDSENGDPEPKIGFATANPPLKELMENTLSLVALTLTTNDLSTSGVSASLDSAGQFPSGIAQLIDKAESKEDVGDQQQLFQDGEKEMWDIIGRWLQHFSEENIIDPGLDSLALPEKVCVNVEFGEPDAVSSESEKLDNLKKRKDMGLNTEAEIMMMDQPSLTQEQAEEKLKKIKEDKAANMASMVINNPGGDNSEPSGEDNESKEDDSEQQQDGE